jgi:hypothetical protein
MHRTIEIIVQPDGQLAIEAMGFSGPDCEKATKFLEQALGTVTGKRKKPDYYRRNLNQKRQQLGG